MFAALVAALTACATPRALPVGGSRALVAPCQRSAELAALVAELEPRVVGLLGTSWPRQYLVRVGELEGHRAETRRGDKRVTIDPDSFDAGLRMTVAHELAHVHARGPWEGLPRGVEEGLAYWVAARATGLADGYSGPEPDPSALRAALALDDEGYEALAEDERGDVHQAAAWLASRLLPAEGGP
jgi:hypothetical protein